MVLLVGSGSLQEGGQPGPGTQLVVAGRMADEGQMQSRWVPGNSSDTGCQWLRGSWGVPMDRCGSDGSVNTGKG